MKRILAVSLGLALIAPQAYAGSFMDAMSQYKKGNIHIGNAELHPWYGLSETYDSNIYLVPDDQPNGVRQGGGVRSAWITKNDLGAGFKLPVSGMHSFDGMYDFNSNNYSKQGNINDYIEQKAGLGYNYKGPMGLAGRLDDNYLNTADPAFSELAGKRSQRWHNGMDAKMDYGPEGGRLRGGVAFTQGTDKYLDGVTNGPLLNRDEQDYAVNGGYMVMPKTKVWAGYTRSVIHYTDFSTDQTTLITSRGAGKDNKSHNFNFGVDGVLAPKVKGSVQTGLTLRRYDEDSNARTKYTRNWMVGANVNWDAMGDGRCMWTLTGSRALQESTFANNRFYIANTAGLNVVHKFPYKLTGHANLGLEIDKYPETTSQGGTTANRRDDTYTQGVGVDYALQDWVSVGLSYQHMQRFSIFSGLFDYNDHQTMLNAKLTF